MGRLPIGRGYTTVLVVTAAIKKRSEKGATFKTCLTGAPSLKRPLVRGFFLKGQLVGSSLKRPLLIPSLKVVPFRTFPESFTLSALSIF